MTVPQHQIGVNPCPGCIAMQEEWEVEAGWRCRDCRTPLGAPKGRFGGSRLCKSCTSNGRSK